MEIRAAVYRPARELEFGKSADIESGPLTSCVARNLGRGLGPGPSRTESWLFLPPIDCSGPPRCPSRPASAVAAVVASPSVVVAVVAAVVVATEAGPAAEVPLVL